MRQTPVWPRPSSCDDPGVAALLTELIDPARPTNALDGVLTDGSAPPACRLGWIRRRAFRRQARDRWSLSAGDTSRQQAFRPRLRPRKLVASTRHVCSRPGSLGRMHRYDGFDDTGPIGQQTSGLTRRSGVRPPSGAGRELRRSPAGAHSPSRRATDRPWSRNGRTPNRCSGPYVWRRI